MVFNPPYGERLEIDMENFYKSIGDTLKQGYSNTDAWFITSNLEALKHVGLRPSRKIKVFNGKLESRLVKYEMYAGSKKGKYMEWCLARILLVVGSSFYLYDVFDFLISTFPIFKVSKKNRNRSFSWIIFWSYVNFFYWINCAIICKVNVNVWNW